MPAYELIDQVVQDFVYTRERGLAIPPVLYARRQNQFVAKKIQRQLMLYDIDVVVELSDDYPEKETALATVPRDAND